MTRSLGPWELGRLLGEGGTASVYVARRGDGPPRALKILRQGAVPDDMRARFRREIEAMRALEHPRIVRLHDAGEDDGQLWYAMDLLEKRPLRDLYVERFRDRGIFQIREVLTLAGGMSDALAYLHEQAMIHRDLKPDNLLATPELDPTLLDLGLARLVDRSRLTAEGIVMGTPRYMAPEQVLGDEVGPGADVYSFGLVLYEGLTGGLPFEDDNSFTMAIQRTQRQLPPPSQARPNLPPGLERIVLRCLHSAPAERYPSMREVQAELARLDPETGELRAGEAMPGAGVDEALPARTVVGARAPVRSASRSPATVQERRGPAPTATVHQRRAPPAEASLASAPAAATASRAPLLAAVVAGATLAVAGLLLRGPGAPEPPALENLRRAVGAGRMELAFSTSRPARVWLTLTPPGGEELRVSPEPRTTHHLAIDDLDPGVPVRLELRLEGQEGRAVTRDMGTVTPQEEAPPLDRVQDVRAQEEGDRLLLSFTTPRPCQARVEYAGGQRAEALLTGGLIHRFELLGVRVGDSTPYSIELRGGGGALPVSLEDYL